MKGAYLSEAIKHFLREHEEFTTKEFICYIVGYGILPGSARNMLVNLQYLGIIERVGRGRYRVVKI